MDEVGEEAGTPPDEALSFFKRHEAGAKTAAVWLGLVATVVGLVIAGLVLVDRFRDDSADRAFPERSTPALLTLVDGGCTDDGRSVEVAVPHLSLFDPDKTSRLDSEVLGIVDRELAGYFDSYQRSTEPEYSGDFFPESANAGCDGKPKGHVPRRPRADCQL